MRLTTKITFGIILSLFLIPLIFIICLSFTDRKNHNSFPTGLYEVPQANQTAVPLASFKTLIIDEASFDTPDIPHFWMTNDCRAKFTPHTSKSATNTLYIPEALKDFVEQKTSNDTLWLRLNIGAIAAIKYNDGNYTNVSVSGINLHFDIEQFDIINKLQNLDIVIKNVETDRIKVNSHSNIHIDSCKTQEINPYLQSQYKKLTVTHCEAQKLYLDIDQIKNWNIEHSNIKEEYFSGSKKHSLIQHRREPGNIIWQPKNKDAQLNVTIQGDTTRINIL